MIGDRAELLPEYADQKLNVPLALHDGGADPEIDVKVIAVVVGKYQPLR